jgi:hypothetical protein
MSVGVWRPVKDNLAITDSGLRRVLEDGFRISLGCGEPRADESPVEGARREWCVLGQTVVGAAGDASVFGCPPTRSYWLLGSPGD